MNESGSGREWGTEAGVAVVLLGLYVGAYSATVRPEFIRLQNMIGASRIVVVPRYGHSDDDGETVAASFFAPIHWLDRRFRPHVWEP